MDEAAAPPAPEPTKLPCLHLAAHTRDGDLRRHTSASQPPSLRGTQFPTYGKSGAVLSAGAAYASGEVGTFNVEERFYGTDRRFDPKADLFYQRNLLDAHLKLAFAPPDTGVKVFAEGFVFLQPTTQDHWQTVAFGRGIARAGVGHGARSVGGNHLLGGVREGELGFQAPHHEHLPEQDQVAVDAVPRPHVLDGHNVPRCDARHGLAERHRVAEGLGGVHRTPATRGSPG